MTTNYPSEEKYGLSSQLRRAAVSVPSNIAERYGRKTIREYILFLYVAYGSLCEIETQLLLTKDLKYIEEKFFTEIRLQLSEVERMLKALIKSLEKKTIV